MGKIMKPTKCVLVLSGRFAGRKGIVVKNYDEGTADRPYGHALVVGIDRYPRKVIRKMSKKKIEQRSKLRPFIRVYNYTHLLPTRYSVDVAFNKALVNRECLRDAGQKRKALREVKQALQERYLFYFQMIQ
ncbi:unnamed protein product [Soboliphyme baturini]|uniref:Large ribosomal subunit protein eL27 n=1 Tax=Soboliphyme baturini TaxID=241478 RepID=A0A183ITD8_9BILA|nr:unnamed protein product [Soboliphyme baturini]